jgi:Big-like domain-containing protein
LEARSSDKAGNAKTIATALHVDTVSPSTSFTSHVNNQVVSGVVRLKGLTSDSTSGVQFAEISVDGGATWTPATISNGSWSYDWDTRNIPNGIYLVNMRAVDNAGNREQPIALALIVDNLPPNVKITDSWWIWESGTLKVSTSGISISEIKVTISDPKGRWPSVVLTYDPSTTSSDVTWDRRFSDGMIAPSGNYHVTVLACDIYGNCASDRGVIKIPFIAPIPPTATPSLLPSPTPISTITAVPSPISHVPTVVPQTPLVETTKPVREPTTVVPQRARALPTLAVVSLIALMWALSSAALADPRPKAILEIAKTISHRRRM